jgi:superfamily II RNA helicase
MAGRAGRRNIDTIGHVIMMTNLYNMLDSTQYYKLLHSNPKILKSKFKINYTLLLHYLNNYSLSDCSSLIEKSLMNQDIINEIKLCDEKVNELNIEYKQQHALLTNELACKVYIDLNKDYAIAKNKIRRQILQQITTIETEVRDIKSQVIIFNKVTEINNEITLQETNKLYAERYIMSQVQSIYNILTNNNYLNETLTTKGVMACCIHEIHPLVFCDTYEKYNGFKDYSSIDIFCLLSCLYDIKVSDELKDLSPTFLKDELTFMNERIYYYYDEEVKYQLTNTDQTLNYDMMPYIKLWMETCDDAISSIQLIQRMKIEKKWFTGDFIKCCLKLVNMAKEIETCNNL